MKKKKQNKQINKEKSNKDVEDEEMDDIAAYCLTNYATVVDLILEFLTSKQLCAASCVCCFWNEAAKRIKSKRKKILTKLISIPEEEENEFSMELIGDSLKSFVTSSKIYPSAAMIYISRSDEYFGSMNHQKSIKKSVKSVFKALPPSSPLIGCLGGGIIGCNNLKSKEFEMTESASLLLLPDHEGVRVSQFFLTLTDIHSAGKDVNKWRDMIGIDKVIDVKLILMHACCEIEDVEKTIDMLVEVTGPDTVISGGLAESIFFNQKVRLRGISGICFSGNVCAGLIVHKERRNKQSMISSLEKLKDIVQPNDHTVMFMYSCVARGAGLYREPNVETNWVAEVLPRTPVAGMFAFGEIGYDPKTTTDNQNEQSSLHSYSTVLCLCKFSP